MKAPYQWLVDNHLEHLYEQSPQASVLLAEQEPMTASSNRGDIYSKPKAGMPVFDEDQALIEDQIYSAGCLK